jgi:hypothetical protein
MSDIPSDWRGQLDIREQIVRIDRDLADIHKLQAETRKFNRDPWILAFAAMTAAFATVVAGVFARLPELLALFGLK